MNTFTRWLRKKWALYIFLCAPIFYVFVPISQYDTEYLADPAKYLLEYVGKAATILFVIVSCITPLKMVFPKVSLVNVLVFHRRQIGVSVFVYALLHLVIYYFYTGTWEIFLEDWNKLFILSGIIALALLLVLAVTSNNWSLKRLGPKRWKQIHRLSYLIMFLLIFHQAAQEKTGYRETAIYFAPLIVLQGYRVIKLATKKRTEPLPSEATRH